MGFFALPFLKGRQARVHKSSKSCRQGERAAGPPEDSLEGSNKAARGRAQANVALSVRLGQQETQDTCPELVVQAGGRGGACTGCPGLWVTDGCAVTA